MACFLWPTVYTVSHKKSGITEIVMSSKIKSSDCTSLNFSTIYLCYSQNKIRITSEQSLSALSTSFSVTIATVNISNSWEISTVTRRNDGKNVNRKRRDLQDMFEMASFHTDTGLKPLSPLIDSPCNDCLPKVWPYINQVLFQIVDVVWAILINMVLKRAPNSVIDWI